MPSYPEGDQVVPSFRRLSVYEHISSLSSHRTSKPLPPLPDQHCLSSDEEVDSEVEFFSNTDDRQRLVPEHRSKTLAFRYGVPSRRSFRGCGQVNYAYHESSKSACGSSSGVCQGQEKLYSPKSPREQPSMLPRDCARPMERPQRRLRRTHSGPAGSFKTASLRLIGQLQDKPEVPPRIPIPPLPAKSSELRQRWSALVLTGGEVTADGTVDDKPPEIPPREPIPCSCPQTPSPRTLPIYVNGVMPPTQSFAPNPKYVSRTPQPRPHHEGLSLTASTFQNPCILPIMEGGKKASATHYFLLPKRPSYLNRYTRYFKDTECEQTEGGCN